MKVLVLGAGGMLGHKLVQHFSSKFETIGTLRSPLKNKITDFCFAKAKIMNGICAEDTHSIARLLDAEKPTALVNCIGIIKQLKASYDPISAIQINALLPHQLANLCSDRNMRFIHVSTDCVFDGKKGDYNEEDRPNCEDLYGRSKLMGEVTGKGAFTIRTSIIGREIQRGLSLVEWFLSQKGKKVKGYKGALYTGFTTNYMAEVVASLLEEHAKLEGLWHISSDPINKFELLQLINKIYKLGILIEPESDFNCDRRLDSSRFRDAAHFTPPSWEEMIEKMYQDPTPYLSNEMLK